MPNVIDGKGTVLREIAPHEIFATSDVPQHVIFRAVHREFANARAGTASTKKRD
ncbi:MAG TPA: hypothetical protein VIN40_05870 [Candidatus Tyrphobacter sp.]